MPVQNYCWVRILFLLEIAPFNGAFKFHINTLTWTGDTGFVSPDLSPKWFGTGWDALGPKFRQKSVIPDDFGTPWDLTEPPGTRKKRRGWDSNPRRLSPRWFSRPEPSTTRPPLPVRDHDHDFHLSKMIAAAQACPSTCRSAQLRQVSISTIDEL